MSKIDNHTNTCLSEIKESGLLSPVLFEKVQRMLPEIRHNFETQTIWRTETEIRCSVLNDKDFPDKAAKYHQAKLEQMVFFEQLLWLALDYRKKEQELVIKEAEVEEWSEKLTDNTLRLYERKKLEAELGIKEIEKQELLYNLQMMQAQGKERVRELEIWSKIKKELDDGSFDINNKDNNQLLSLTKRYVQEAWNAAHTGSSSDISSVNNILAQFQMLVKECIARGKMDEVLSYFGFDSNISQWLVQTFGISPGGDS